MVIDLRKVSKKDILSKTAIFSRNYFDASGFNPIKLIRSSKKVKEDQDNFFVVVNYAKEVETDQLNILGVVNYAKEVGDDQGNILGGVNFAEKVGNNQGNGIGLGNFAEKVGHDQWNALGLINYAKEVGNNQMNVFGLINYAKEVRGHQENAILCIQTKNKKSNQRGCLIRYNPLEKIGFGGSVWSKIEKTEKYLNKIEKNSGTKYLSILNSFVRERPTLRKRLTGHNTRTDILSRQAKRRFKTLTSRV